MNPKGIATWLVCSHAALAAAHGATHTQLAVDLTSFQSAFVVTVILAAPFAALASFRGERPRLALAVLGGSLAAAFLFGLLFHFALPGADNVSGMSHQSWGSAFRVTAIGLEIIEGTGCAWCVWALTGSTSAARG